MARKTEDQNTEIQDQNTETSEAVETVEPTEVVKSRIQRVKAEVVLQDGNANFSYSIAGLTNEDGSDKPVAFGLDLNSLLTKNEFIFKAAIEGIKSQLQTSYAGVTSPVEIEKIISDKVSSFVEGIFESRMFSEKKVVIHDVVAAHMRHVGADLSNAAEVAKYTASWDSKNKTEQTLFRNSKGIVSQLILIEQERIAKKAAKLANADLPDMEITAL